jgi:hypothetical protein
MEKSEKLQKKPSPREVRDGGHVAVERRGDPVAHQHTGRSRERHKKHRHKLIISEPEAGLPP